MNLVVELQENLGHKVENSYDSKLETREQTSLCHMRNIRLWLKIEDRDSRRKQSRACCQSTQTPEFRLRIRDEV